MCKFLSFPSEKRSNNIEAVRWFTTSEPDCDEITCVIIDSACHTNHEHCLQSVGNSIRVRISYVMGTITMLATFFWLWSFLGCSLQVYLGDCALAHIRVGVE